MAHTLLPRLRSTPNQEHVPKRTHRHRPSVTPKRAFRDTSRWPFMRAKGCHATATQRPSMPKSRSDGTATPYGRASRDHCAASRGAREDGSCQERTKTPAAFIPPSETTLPAASPLGVAVPSATTRRARRVSGGCFCFLFSFFCFCLGDRDSRITAVPNLPPGKCGFPNLPQKKRPRRAVLLTGYPQAVTTSKTMPLVAPSHQSTAAQPIVTRPHPAPGICPSRPR